MKPGAFTINTTFINAKKPSPQLLAYAATKGAIANFTVGLAGRVAKKGICVNAVAPGPIWTPLIPSTIWRGGAMGRAGQLAHTCCWRPTTQPT